MNLDVFKEENWGPWLVAEKVSFHVGDIIILSIDGDELNTKPIYKIDSFEQLNRDAHMSAYNPLNWSPGGYAWVMKGSAKVRLYKGSSNTVSAPASVGIACQKCKAFNEYAIANQSDGQYICYNCR